AFGEVPLSPNDGFQQLPASFALFPLLDGYQNCRAPPSLGDEQRPARLAGVGDHLVRLAPQVGNGPHILGEIHTRECTPLMDPIQGDGLSPKMAVPTRTM